MKQPYKIHEILSVIYSTTELYSAEIKGAG